MYKYAPHIVVLIIAIIAIAVLPKSCGSETFVPGEPIVVWDTVYKEIPGEAIFIYDTVYRERKIYIPAEADSTQTYEFLNLIDSLQAKLRAMNVERIAELDTIVPPDTISIKYWEFKSHWLVDIRRGSRIVRIPSKTIYVPFEKQIWYNETWFKVLSHIGAVYVGYEAGKGTR